MKRIAPALAALMLAACASAPVVPEAPTFSGPPPGMPADLSPAAVAAADDFLWLEEVQGERALAWVEQQNARTLAVLEGDPRYEAFREQAFAILSAQDRIPFPSVQGGMVFNFWQDEQNPKGLWRRTTLESYRSADTQWETVLDVGALARAEGKDWVWKGSQCLQPEERYCLVNLSDGGKDAVEVREFDTHTGRFVEGGFHLPEGKHRVTWLDADTLLVATDFGPGTLTESGYPYIIKSLERGQTLAQAVEVYRGEQADGGYGVSPYVLRDPDGQARIVLANRPLDTFSSETWVLRDGRATHRLPLPPRASVQGLQDGQLVFTVEEDFAGHRSGALLSWSADAARERENPGAPALVTQPSARQSIEGVAATAGGLVVNLYDEVSGGLQAHAFDNGVWRRTRVLDVPENASVSIADASSSRTEFFAYTQGFLTPATLMQADAATGATVVARTSPARFNAADHVVEQFQATSADGTQIPYFVVRPRGLVMDGSAATIMYGYGGFQVSKPPAYIPEMGKLWLEHGGVYVNANIRGGGEFGPSWHQSALNENRQRAFDDYAAVGEDLIARGITSPEHLGIYGRSNGGVLTSVAITQRPELFNAAVIESPLIDMLRYHEMPAGASWIGEYGDPRIPEEAAWIARYSAYQQLRPEVDYPTPYITTNTLDDRVHPGHARKFAARMAQQGHDYLYFEDTAGGHSYDADPAANARRWARHYVYLSQQLMD